jgi:hypothetical protein
MSEGFGVQPPSKIDKLVEQAVRYAQKRSPESIDTIFDNLPVKLNIQALNGAVVALQDDIDTLAWLCGYFASEINRSEDNDNPHHFIEKQGFVIKIVLRDCYCMATIITVKVMPLMITLILRSLMHGCLTK